MVVCWLVGWLVGRSVATLDIVLMLLWPWKMLKLSHLSVVVAVGVIDMSQVIGDTRHLTHEMLHLTPDT